MIRHRFHCRYDITNVQCYPLLLEFIRQGKMQLLSFMDHTPGQGQYRDLEFFKNQVMGGSESDEEKDRILKQRMERAKVTEEQLKQAADLAWEKGIPIASHDDDSVEKLDYVTRPAPCGHLRIPRGALGGAGGQKTGDAGGGRRHQRADGPFPFRQLCRPWRPSAGAAPTSWSPTISRRPSSMPFSAWWSKGC